MKLPIIDLEEEKKEIEKAEFTIKSIQTVNLENSKKEYVYNVEVKEELDSSNYTKIAVIILDNIKNKEDFQSLYLEITKNNKVLFTFKY